MADSFQIIIVIVVLTLAVVFLYLLPRYGPHKKSVLTCPKCKKQFTYHWVPGASWVSLGRGTKRKLQCPCCHQFSAFELTATQIERGIAPTASKPN